MTPVSPLNCPNCRARTTERLSRLPDGRFVCVDCYREALAKAFSVDELGTISAYCRSVADRLRGTDRNNWTSRFIGCAMRDAAIDSGMGDDLLERFWAHSRADFEFWTGTPGERMQ